MNFLKNFIRFSRLHTVIGTTLSIVSLYLIALSYSDFSDLHLGLLILTLLSCLGANIYIVGLNQITDVDIDRINKPYLPLASGAFSMRLGYGLIIASVLISLTLAILIGRYLLLTVILSLVLGTAYSLPPLRLKRFYFWAAFCIIAVRGLIVNTLLFLHFNFHINSSNTIPTLVLLLTAIIFIYSIVIAWFKDIPDMEGDRRYQIRTLTLRLGARSVFNIGNGLVMATYVAVMTLPWWAGPNATGGWLAGVHLGLLLLLIAMSRKADLGKQTAIKRYYQFIWVLFFLEYISFAVIVLINH